MLNGTHAVFKFDRDLYLSLFGTWKPKDNKKIRIYFIFFDQYHNAQYRKISFVTGNFEQQHPMQFFTYILSKKEFLKEIGL